MVENKTLGEIRVSLDFNPEGNSRVNAVKKHHADLIDDLEGERLGASKEKKRTISRAQTLIEDACMLSVKSIFQ